MTARWTVVVPVKALAVAKTRLALPAPLREELALAMALDVVAAALACPVVTGVVVVSDDPRAVAALPLLGATVVPDEPDAGLNPALEHGAEVAVALHPTAGVAVVSSDLPALRPAELSAALSTADAHVRAFVSDDAGTGTTLLAVRAPAAAGARVALGAAYGTGSAARHRDSGAADISRPVWAGLRRDVDTLADLAHARSLGVGPRTLAVLPRVRDLP